MGYGNNDYVAKWKFSNEFHRNGSTYKELLFIEGITWSAITSGKFSARYYGNGFIFDHASPSLFAKSAQNLFYYLGLLNSSFSENVLRIINPTINMGADSVRKLPVIVDSLHKVQVDNIVKQNISLSRSDWDAFETSWDFKRHPLV